MVAEVAGKRSPPNVAEKGKTQKQIIRDCLKGGTDGPRPRIGFPAGWRFRSGPMATDLRNRGSRSRSAGKPGLIDAKNRNLRRAATPSAAVVI